LNFREGPSLREEVISVLDFGSEQIAIGRTPNGFWILLSVDGKTGWSFALWLRPLEGDLEDLPIVDDNLVYPIRNMRVRNGPGFDFDVIGLIRVRQKVEVIGQSEDGKWILIKFGEGETGWSYKYWYRDRITLRRLGELPVVEQPTAQGQP
jgi:uncharacterized protein YraI